MPSQPNADNPPRWVAWTQGTVLQGVVAGIIVAGEICQVSEDRFVVLTQDCDIVRVERPWLQIAPVVDLHGNEGRQAALFKRPRYLPLPHLGQDKFGDLDRVITSAKSDLNDAEVVVQGPSGKAARVVAEQIGRKFERLPLPNEVDATLRPLAQYLSSKARLGDTPLGKMVARIDDVVLEAKWSSRPLDIKLVLILKEGELPPLSDDEIDESLDFEATLRDADGRVVPDLQALAEKLAERTTAPIRLALWNLVAETIAEKSQPSLSEGHVNSVKGEAIGAESMTYARLAMTARIDLDVLCPDPRAEDESFE